MKRKILIVSLVLNLLLIISLVLTINISRTKVYTFSGINDYIEIEGGSIVKSNDFEQVRCGSFRYINKVPEDTYSYALKLYVMEDDKQVIVSQNSMQTNPDLPARVEAENIVMYNGSASYGKIAKKLEDISEKNLINNLYFEIILTTTDQKEITQRLKLDVVPVQ